MIRKALGLLVLGVLFLIAAAVIAAADGDNAPTPVFVLQVAVSWAAALSFFSGLVMLAWGLLRPRPSRQP